jgi:hypothetical protein
MTPLQQTYLTHHRNFKALGYKPLTLAKFYDAVFGREAIETYFRKQA